MGKKSATRSLEDNEARAIIRNLRISPQKLNLLAEQIRGKPVQKALMDLEFSRRRISGAVKTGLESAIANAENNHQLDVDRLIVSEATVGKAFVMKRWRARARGRVAPIQKPFSQITLVVREQEEA
jgi:large subunit ribosomal protein L22